MKEEINEITGIFKYRTYESAKKIIQSGTLFFSKPITFNDHFDCSPEILNERFYFDYTTTHDPFFDRELEELASKYSGNEYVKQWLSNPEKVCEIYKSIQPAKIATCSVLCFSLYPNIKLNWANYGDAGKGICLGFDIETVPFFYDIENDEITWGTVTYGWPKEKINFFHNKLESLKAIFLTKTHDWKHEEEFRMILLYREGGCKFNPLALNSITFGLKVEDFEIYVFRQLCIDNGFRNLNYYKITTAGENLVIKKIDFKFK